jgi:hypothetical protein
MQRRTCSSSMAPVSQSGFRPNASACACVREAEAGNKVITSGLHVTCANRGSAKGAAMLNDDQSVLHACHAIKLTRQAAEL